METLRGATANPASRCNVKGNELEKKTFKRFRARQKLARDAINRARCTSRNTAL